MFEDLLANGMRRRYGTAAAVDNPQARTTPQAATLDAPAPPAPTPQDLAPAARAATTVNPVQGGAQPAAPQQPQFEKTSVAGVYKVRGPDGSTTFTDTPGGSFSPIDQREPTLRRDVMPGTGRPRGEMGTGVGNFSANEVAGTGAKFRYDAPDTAGAVDAGTAAGHMPGSTEWMRANTAAVDPNTPAGARQLTANKRALVDFRTGSGANDRAPYDPTNYASLRRPGGGTGINGYPAGVNPLDVAKTFTDIKNKNDATERANTKQTFDLSQEEHKRTEGVQSRYYDALKDSNLDEPAKRRIAAVQSLPELFHSNPAYLQSDAGRAALSDLYSHVNNLLRPRGVAPSGPGEEQLRPGDDVSVRRQGPIDRLLHGADFALQGPLRKPVAGPNGNEFVPAQEGEAGATRNEYAGTGYGGGAINPLNWFGDNREKNATPESHTVFGKQNQDLARYAPIFEHLRKLKESQSQPTLRR